MKPHILLKDGDKYSGQYVALKSFYDKKVVSHGTKAKKVLKDARRKGIQHPVIFYVPQKGMVHIYKCL